MQDEPLASSDWIKATATDGTEDVALHVLLSKFIVRRADGRWALDNPVTKSSAKEHLRSLGYEPGRVADIFDRGLFPLVHGIDIAPGESSIFRRGPEWFLNAYVPSSIQPHPGEFPTINEMLSTVTGGDQNGVEWLINWMAFKVQNPATRSMVAVVCQGGQGIGKTTLGNVLADILGRENCSSIGQNSLENAFNGQFARKLFVVADEVIDKREAIATSNLLKKYITDSTLVVNSKNVQQYEIVNRLSWWFTSNASVPVRIEGKADRRYTVFLGPSQPDLAYGARLRACFRNGEPTAAFAAEVAAFAHHLHTVSVDSLLISHPHENDARDLVARSSRASVEVFFDEIDERGSIDAMIVEYLDRHAQTRAQWRFCRSGLNCADMYAVYRAFCEKNGFRQVLASPGFGRELKLLRPGWARERDSTGQRRWYYTDLPRDESVWKDYAIAIRTKLGLDAHGFIKMVPEPRSDEARAAPRTDTGAAHEPPPAAGASS